MSFISIPVQFLECQEAPIEQIFHHPEEGVPKSTQADHDSMYLLSQGPTFRDRGRGGKRRMTARSQPRVWEARPSRCEK